MRELQRAVVKRCDQANKSFIVYSGTATPSVQLNRRSRSGCRLPFHCKCDCAAALADLPRWLAFLDFLVLITLAE